MTDPSERRLSAREMRRAILESHRELGALLTEIEHAPDDGIARTVLLRLRPALARHFAHEEAPDGLYGILRDKGPWLDREIGRLMTEHATMLDDVASLARRARGLREATRRLVARLREHERRESELLDRALAEREAASPPAVTNPDDGTPTAPDPASPP